MTNYFKKFKLIVLENYIAIIMEIRNNSNGCVGISYEDLKRITGCLKQQSILWELKYALYIFDLWVYSETVIRKGKTEKELVYWIRKVQPEDKLSSNLQEKYDADRNINYWRKKAGYLFCWENVPGNDSNRLLSFLKDVLNINWSEKAKVIKTNANKTIHISFEGKLVEIELDENKEKAMLKISNGHTYNLQVKEENGKFNIYIEWLPPKK